ncbi:protein sel-1 homolog 3-like [Glandiceps talaboti]
MAARIPKDVYFRFILVYFIFLSKVYSSLVEHDTLSLTIHSKSIKHHEYIIIQNPPTLLTQNYVLKVLYMCNTDSVVGVQLYASSDFKQNVRVFEKLWRCRTDSHVIKTRTRYVKVVLPDIVAYREDYMIKNSINVYNVNLRAWLFPGTQVPENHDLAYTLSQAKVRFYFKVLPPYSRPYKSHQVCPQWNTENIQKYKKVVIKQCPWQPEVIDLLSFPVAFTGGYTGVTKQLPQYTDKILIEERKHYFRNPKYTLSMWVYLLEYCSVPLCTLLKRKTQYDNQYITPLVLVTDKGQLHLQVVQGNQQPYSYLPSMVLPLKQWFRLIYTQDGNKWDVWLNYGDNYEKEIHTFQSFPNGVYMDDLNGLVHLGGSRSMVGFKGYMAQTTFYRRQIKKPKQIAIPNSNHPMFSVGLSTYYDQCERFLNRTKYRIQVYQTLLEEYHQQRSCTADLIQFVKSYYSQTEKTEIQQLQCKLWGGRTPRRYANLYVSLREIVMNGVSDFKARHREKIGESLYDVATVYLREGLIEVPTMIPLLKQASCLGYHKASYMLSVLYNNGAGIKANPGKALLYLLVSTQGDYKLTLMALGTKHYHGLDGFQQDYDYSYNYFKIVAEKSVQDREEHDSSAVYTEHVRLTDTASLESQKGEYGDYFLWLKYQAKHGVGEAQSNLARMLFWGQQGIDRNMAAAVQYYQISAEAEDATAIAVYDYGIILMKGQGVQKNIPKALENLNKSAEMGHPPAYSALGWYASTFEHDTEKAAHYWEKADQLGDRDAAYNLGHLYNSGKYPGKSANQSMAFDYFYKAARLGHIDGGVTLSYYYNQGVRGYVERNSHFASIWAKYIAEQYSVDVGALLRKGVDGYLDQSWSETYVYYLMAAETGLEVAQFNMAYLCEENHDGLTTSYIEKECVWKYYNLSTLAEFPHPHAQIKMGDYYWYGCDQHRDVNAAVDMYVKAAKANDPHGLFNLAYLVEEGVDIPKHAWISLGIPVDVYNKTEKRVILTELYNRCRDHNNEESFVPCSLALLRIQLMDVWTKYSVVMQFSSAIGVAIVTYITLSAIRAQIRQQHLIESV